MFTVGHTFKNISLQKEKKNDTLWKIVIIEYGTSMVHCYLDKKGIQAGPFGSL